MLGAGIGVGIGLGIPQPAFDPLLVSGQAPHSIYRTDELAAVADGGVDPWTAALGSNLVAISGAATPTIGTDPDGIRSVHCDGSDDAMRTSEAEANLRFFYDDDTHTWTVSWVQAIWTEPTGTLRAAWGTGGWSGAQAGVALIIYGSGAGANRGQMKMFLANGSSSVTIWSFNLLYPHAHVFRFQWNNGGSPKGRLFQDGVELLQVSTAFTTANAAGDANGFVIGAQPDALNQNGDGFQRFWAVYTPQLADGDGATLDGYLLKYLEDGP